jgi:hypothetical protein
MFSFTFFFLHYVYDQVVGSRQKSYRICDHIVSIQEEVITRVKLFLAFLYFYE